MINIPREDIFEAATLGTVRGMLTGGMDADAWEGFEVQAANDGFFRLLGQPLPPPGNMPEKAGILLRDLFVPVGTFIRDKSSTVLTFKPPKASCWLHTTKIVEAGDLFTLVFSDVSNVVTFQDEYKRLFNQIGQMESNLRTFFDLATDMLWVLDENGIVLETNASERLGYPAKGLIGKSVLDAHPEDVRTEALRIVMAMLRGDEQVCPLPLLTYSGNRLPVETRVSWGVWNGKPAIFGSSRDMSDLMLSEEKFHRAFNASPALMAISTPREGKFIDVNDTFLVKLGFSREEVIGHTSRELCLYSDYTQRDSIAAKVASRGGIISSEQRTWTRQGRELQGVYENQSITIGSQNLLFSTMIDLTEQKMLEAELHKLVKFEELLVNCTSSLLRATELDIDPTLDAILADIGAYSASDRIYIFTIDERVGTMSNAHEWCAPGIEPRIQRLQGILMGRFDKILLSLVKDKEVLISDIREVPDAWAEEKAILQNEGIRSLLILPIQFEARLLGFIGFDSVNECKNWPLESRNLLRMLASNLAATWVRIEQQELLRQAVINEQRLVKIAEFANSSKNEFISIVSHEIRTPMNGVVNAARFLGAAITDPGQRRYIDMLESSSGTLLKVVNDVLDLSKMEFGKMEVENAEFDIRYIMEQCFEPYTISARQKGLDFTCSVDPSVPRHMINDPSRISQVIGNLLSNSVKFTDSGSVRLKVDMAELTAGIQYIRFTVQDTGGGIPGVVMDHLFERFNQSKAGGSDLFTGSGMGLRVVKKLTDLLGGRVEVETAAGKGTTFTVFMPNRAAVLDRIGEGAKVDEIVFAYIAIGTDPGQVRGLVDSLKSWGLPGYGFGSLAEAENFCTEHPRDRIVCMLLDDIAGTSASKAPSLLLQRENLVLLARTAGIEKSESPKPVFPFVNGVIFFPWSLVDLQQEMDDYFKFRQPRTKGKAKYRYRGVKALLVEDNPINVEIARAFLEQAGICVDSTGNGHAAVEYVRKNRYDFVLMDIQIEGSIDGYGVTGLIRALPDPQARQVPIIALTAHALVKDRERCLKAGMNDHLGQPIDSERLFRTIDKWTVPGKRVEVAASNGGMEASAKAKSTATKVGRQSGKSDDANKPAGSRALLAETAVALQCSIREREPKECEKAMGVLLSYCWEPPIGSTLAGLAAYIEAYNFARAETEVIQLIQLAQ